MAGNPPRETPEGFAKREVRTELERAATREKMLKNATLLSEKMPSHFFEFCTMLRENVTRFNATCDPARRIFWRESAALAARDANPNADFNLTFNRDLSEVNVGLNAMGRGGKPAVFLIDVNGKIRGDQVFMARVEGQAREQIVFRITVNFKKQECDMKTFAERLVMGVVTQEFWYIFDDPKR